MLRHDELVLEIAMMSIGNFRRSYMARLISLNYLFRLSVIFHVFINILNYGPCPFRAPQAHELEYFVIIAR